MAFGGSSVHPRRPKPPADSLIRARNLGPGALTATGLAAQPPEPRHAHPHSLQEPPPAPTYGPRPAPPSRADRNIAGTGEHVHVVDDVAPAVPIRFSYPIWREGRHDRRVAGDDPPGLRRCGDRRPRRPTVGRPDRGREWASMCLEAVWPGARVPPVAAQIAAAGIAVLPWRASAARSWRASRRAEAALSRPAEIRPAPGGQSSSGLDTPT